MRADELAARAGISVQLLRSYQSKGLVPPPTHQGRLAWYGRTHLDRLTYIRERKDAGYSLRMIALTLAEGSDVPAVPKSRQFLTLHDVAEQAKVPAALIRALEASGMLRPYEVDGEFVFTDADVRFVRHVLTLLGVGLPLDVFLDIAGPFVAASQTIAQATVAAWDDLVASHLRAAKLPLAELGERTATSAEALATIVGELVGYNVERSVLQAVQRHLQAEGSVTQQRALAEHLRPPRNE